MKTQDIPYNKQLVRPKQEGQIPFKQGDKSNVNFSIDLTKPKTQKQIHIEIEEDLGLKYFNFNKAKNLSTIGLNRLPATRVMENTFGPELGNKVNNLLIYPTITNEKHKVDWKNKERSEISSYGIKARSKESAAVQKYGERGYIDHKTHKYVKYELSDLQKEFPKQWRQIARTADNIKGKYKQYLNMINDTKVFYFSIKTKILSKIKS